jgi:hypothetical protein
MALFGREHVAGECCHRIARHAVAVQLHVAEIVLRPSVTLCRRAGKPLHGPCRIGGHAPTVLVTAAKHVLRVRVSGFRSACKPAERCGFVSRRAFAGKQHPAQPYLCLHKPMFRRRANPQEGTLRIGAQQLFQLFRPHHGERGHAPCVRAGCVRVHIWAHLRTRLW